MKYLALATLTTILVSCSSTKPINMTTSSASKAPLKLGYTWMQTVAHGNIQKRGPAAVKDSETKELIKAMNTYDGWKSVPVGKALTKEDSFYVDGQAETATMERTILKQSKNSYFELIKYESGYEVQVTALEVDPVAALSYFQKSLTAIKKTGPSLYTLVFAVENENIKASCELKMDLKKSALFFINSCKDQQGRLIQESKIVTTRDVELKGFESQLSDISLNVCPFELIGEEVDCVNTEKGNWSYLVK